MFKDNLFLETSEKLANLSEITNKNKINEDIFISEIDIDNKLSKQINKIRGKYITISFNKNRLNKNIEKLIGVLNDSISNTLKYLGINKKSKILFVGLGNKSITCDSLGYHTIEKIGIEGSLYKIYKDVEGITNINSYEFIKSISNTLEIDLVVIFDSLKDLELEDVHDIIKTDKGLDGESAYALQHKSLVDILKSIDFRLKTIGGREMKEVRFGIVGIGQMGGSHATWLAEGKVKNARLTAVCDVNPEKKEWASEKLPSDVKFFDNYIDMLDSKEIDAVLIATPHYDHPVIAIEALNRDLHTLVEKPAGVYTKKVREMNELAESKPHLTFGMMFNQRTNPLYQKIKESGSMIK